ncbi:unnamed protein product [Rodentolepis nana]|uniref:C2 domain-containing protein n=1 Tax=Rodentolepis nana TaxID=102285 RepID=A0A0R3TBD6_RODNA|nr:unnamed protein product [Rodentolepis nana]
MIIMPVLVISELLLMLNLHSISAIKPGKVIADLNLYLYYGNPNHVAAEGYCDRTLNDNWCDTYFTICLTSANSTEKCNVYTNTTEVHYDKTYVKYDKEQAFRIPLKHPIPEPINIEVTVMDYDRFTEPDLIGVFANDVMIPTPNVITSAGLVNVKKNYQQKVKLIRVQEERADKR